MPYLLVAGNLLDDDYTEAAVLAEDVCNMDSTLNVEKRGMLEADFVEFVKRIGKEYGGNSHTHGSGPLFLHSQIGYMGGLDQMLTWATSAYSYADPRSQPAYMGMREQMGEETLANFHRYVRTANRKFCYLEFPQGRVTFELFDKLCPTTCENFMALCTGDKGRTRAGVALHYKGTPIHRVLKNAFLQGGDLFEGRGNYSHSIWGPRFEDESFMVKFDTPGLLAMANTGPHSNGSQFLITLRPLPSFNSRMVAFGRVVGGWDVVMQINNTECRNQRPFEPQCVVSCGTIDPPPEEEKDPKESLIPTDRKSTIVFLGLDNAGKTTIQNNYCGHGGDKPTPTNGFDLDRANWNGHKVTMYGLGGNASIRGYWNNYYDEAYGVVYVIDAADTDRLSEAVAHLEEAMTHFGLKGKPWLLYLNKQDLPGAISATEFASKFKPPKGVAVHVLTTTAKIDEGRRRDPGVTAGLTWILGQIDDERGHIEKKVKEEVAERKRKERLERAERRAKIEKEREARRKAKEEQNAA